MGRRTLKLAPELLAGILMGMQAGPPRFFNVTKDAIPPDAKVVRAGMDRNRVHIELVLESEAWAESEVWHEIKPEFAAYVCPVFQGEK